MIVIRTPGKLLEKLGLQPARVPIPAQAVRAHNLAQRPVREYSDSRRRVVGHILLLLVPENPCCLGSSTVPINLRGDGPSKLVLLLRSPPVFSSTPRPGFYVALVSLALFPADRGLPFPSRAGLAAPPAARHDARGLGLSLVRRQPGLRLPRDDAQAAVAPTRLAGRARGGGGCRAVALVAKLNTYM